MTARLSLTMLLTVPIFHGPPFDPLSVCALTVHSKEGHGVPALLPALALNGCLQITLTPLIICL